MHFRRVCLEAFGYTLPEEVVTTSDIERRLEPLYRRLRLPEGRLELMSGIRERRFFPTGTRPSTVSIESGRKAMTASDIDSRYFGAWYTVQSAATIWSRRLPAACTTAWASPMRR